MAEMTKEKKTTPSKKEGQMDMISADMEWEKIQKKNPLTQPAAIAAFKKKYPNYDTKGYKPGAADMKSKYKMDESVEWVNDTVTGQPKAITKKK